MSHTTDAILVSPAQAKQIANEAAAEILAEATAQGASDAAADGEVIHPDSPPANE